MAEAPLGFDRVRRHTSAKVLACIDAKTTESVRRSSGGDIAPAVERLDAEWDTDRSIELEAAMVGLVGLALGTFKDDRFLAVPAAVGLGVLFHALTGWYPLLPVFRRAGIRSAREIERERYALKALRGDFAALRDRPTQRAAQPATAAPSPIAH